MALTKQYDVPLMLTTPHMKGPAVRDAQWLMAGHSRFKGLATLKDSNVDGDFGLVTANAVKRAKYWCGYPSQSCDRLFGQTLYEYLRPNDWRPLPDTYRDRRAARIAAATSTPGTKALEFATNEIGNHESPYGSNRSKYGEWFGWNGVAWCAIFESYCFAHTGFSRFRTASCEEIVGWARHGLNGCREVWSPMPGDVAVFNLHGNPYAHTSFFERWVDPAAGSFFDLGGNTGPSNISNGGAVMRQTRQRQMVSHFVRVG